MLPISQSRRAPGATRCEALGLYWVVRETPEHGEMLRLARDAEGAELLPTLEEARAEAEQRQAEEARLRAEAEQRLAQLEAELRRLRRGE